MPNGQKGNGVEPPKCYGCKVELSTDEYYNCVQLQGRVYRLCKNHDVILSTAIGIMHQIMTLELEEKLKKKKGRKKNEGV